MLKHESARHRSRSHAFAIAIILCLLHPSLLHSQYPQMEFPLHLGDLWQYQEAPGIIHETRATGTTILGNGKEYTHLEGSLFGGYFRKQDAKVYQFLPGPGFEIILFDFSRKRGDTVSIYPISHGDSLFVIVTDENPGQSHRYMSFKEIDLHTKQVLATYVVSDSLGIFTILRELIPLYLVGAVIDGRQYGIITDVTSNVTDIPERVELLQNYPNPFNPTTNFGLRIVDCGFVSLKVFDVLGREVATLVNEVRSPGTYTVRWDGSGQPSGVYFYRLEAGPFIETRRMVLVK